MSRRSRSPQQNDRLSHAQKIARFALQLSHEAVPAEVRESAKLQILDTLGCGLAASSLGEGVAAREVVAEIGGVPEATVIGHPVRLPANAAALANGSLCHALDFDNTHAAADLHVGVVVVPAALASAETVGATGTEFLSAIVAASETVVRLGACAPFSLTRRGFHTTPVCGVFAAALVAARLMRLSYDQTVNALGISGSMASGLFEYLADGSSVKQLHPGWASHAGILATRLSARGATGPASVFEGRFGVYAAFADLTGDPLAEQLADLGERWETSKIAFKPYPACHCIHASLDAVRAIVDREQITADQVASIVATVPAEVVPIVLEPATSKVRPRSSYESKFSLQYSIAAMLVDGHVDIDTYSERRIADRRLGDIAQLVSYEATHYPTFPGAYPGGVRITTVDGATFGAEVLHERGSVENPMNAIEVREKFRNNAVLAVARADVKALESAVLSIDTAAEVSGRLDPMSRARPSGGLAVPPR